MIGKILEKVLFNKYFMILFNLFIIGIAISEGLKGEYGWAIGFMALLVWNLLVDKKNKRLNIEFVKLGEGEER